MFAEIAFPTAVRQTFTYKVRTELFSSNLLGKRVWAPYRKSFAIGVVVKIHQQKPDFDIKEIKEVLDDKPVVHPDLLKITEWIHKFYFCSWGEVIQAALPAGLNYISETYLRTNTESFKPSDLEKFVLEEIETSDFITEKEALSRWNKTKYASILKKLLKLGVIERWQKPLLKAEAQTEKWIEWEEGKSAEIAEDYVASASSLNKWQTSLQELTTLTLPIKYDEIKQHSNLTGYTFQKLRKEGWIRVTKKEVTGKYEYLIFEPDSLKMLNEEQYHAFNEIQDKLDADCFANILLYGITGSGKTEVYIHTLKKVIEAGKSGIVLVPEIALTPQTVSRFYRIFGDEIAVLHSRLTNKERLSEWNQIESGRKRIVIGPRSAVFAPVKNLGVIIIDEEHDASYKQIDPAPRYHAREVAIVRAQFNNAIVVMGSATPSLQALEMVNQGKAIELMLTQRHAGAELPEVEIIDLTQYSGAMRGPLSVALYRSIEVSLKNNEQVILLYNRRGFANYMQCADCGNIPQSPESSVSLTYHKRNHILKCHYSGYSRKADTECEACGSTNLLIQGSGTQKIEDELAELFSETRILRFDKDSTSRKGSHERILTKFGNREADILIGTQLVAKGLDFPNVTTVGVIDADTEQAFPAFNSSERLYQLLSQVAGRSGRGLKKGKVYIQTRQADNPAIMFAKKHDHAEFAISEQKFRKELNYPPYSRLIKFVIKGKDEHKVIQSVKNLEYVIQQLLPNHQLLGPSAGVISWLMGVYIWEISIKLETNRGAKFIESALEKIMGLYQKTNAHSASAVRVNINVDAQR